MKVLLLCGDQPNQKALAVKVSQQVTLAGIVIEKKKAKPSGGAFLKKLIPALGDRLLLSPIRTSWFSMMQAYHQQFPEFPSTDVLHTASINSEATVDFIKKINPDLIMVSGTSMIKKNILDIPLPLGMINLHTGLSPYVKGGPNCTNWCIANREWHLIGNTIMWIDAGIDSGNILTTERVIFSGTESLADIHMKVMDSAHVLYLKALTAIQSGAALPSVPQRDIAEGKTYYNREWTFGVRRRLLRNLSFFSADIQSSSYKEAAEKVICVPLAPVR